MEPKENDYLEQLDIIKNYKLLIVDDNRINQIVTKKLFDQISVLSEVTDSGLKAIELAKANQYDCILMDVYMPEMDGYEATKHIRQFNETVSIIALTASSSEEIEKKISAVNMDDYILKPFVIDDVVAKIVKSVEDKKNL